MAAILAYKGNKDQLDDPEKFYLALNTLEGFELRVDAMVLKQDFKPFEKKLDHAIETHLKICKALMNNKSLKMFLGFILDIGNTMNRVSTVNISFFKSYFDWFLVYW